MTDYLNIQGAYQSSQLEAIRMGMQSHLNQDFLYGMQIEAVERALYSLGEEVGFRFKKDIWADKLADDVITESTTVPLTHDVSTFESAWQLWKANHWYAKWFKWTVRWWAKEPQQTGKLTINVNKKAELKFRVCKYHTFPDFNPGQYPEQFGKYYRYIKQDRLGLNVYDA